MPSWCGLDKFTLNFYLCGWRWTKIWRIYTRTFTAKLFPSHLKRLSETWKYLHWHVLRHSRRQNSLKSCADRRSKCLHKSLQRPTSSPTSGPDTNIFLKCWFTWIIRCIISPRRLVCIKIFNPQSLSLNWSAIQECVSWIQALPADSVAGALYHML